MIRRQRRTDARMIAAAICRVSWRPKSACAAVDAGSGSCPWRQSVDLALRRRTASADELGSLTIADTGDDVAAVAAVGDGSAAVAMLPFAAVVVVEVHDLRRSGSVEILAVVRLVPMVELGELAGFPSV